MDRCFEINYSYKNRSPNDYSREMTLRDFVYCESEQIAIDKANEYVKQSESLTTNEVVVINDIWELSSETKEYTRIKQIL